MCAIFPLILYVITSIYDLLYLYTLTVFIKITSNIFAYDMATFLPNFALILNPIIPQCKMCSYSFFLNFSHMGDYQKQQLLLKNVMTSLYIDSCVYGGSGRGETHTELLSGTWLNTKCLNIIKYYFIVNLQLMEVECILIKFYWKKTICIIEICLPVGKKP